MHHTQIKKYSAGFTLLEILISLAIFTLIIGVVGLFARDTFYYKNVFFNGLTTYDDARKVLQPMAGEIRSTTPSSLGAYPLDTVADNTFTFYTDTNGDGLKEKIRYFLSGTILKKGVITPTGTPLVYVAANEVVTNLVGNVQNGTTPVFAYYDVNYTGESNPMDQPVDISLVRMIKITLLVDIGSSSTPQLVAVTTQVSLRNLKDNL